jgi:septum formation topological specificity factor MinE
MSQEVLESVNMDLNNLNVKIAMQRAISKDDKCRGALQTLKNDMINVQSKFVKTIETLYYK